MELFFCILAEPSWVVWANMQWIMDPALLRLWSIGTMNTEPVYFRRAILGGASLDFFFLSCLSSWICLACKVMLYQINLLFLVVNIYPAGAKLTSDKSPSNAVFYTLYINEVQFPNAWQYCSSLIHYVSNEVDEEIFFSECLKWTLSYSE